MPSKRKNAISEAYLHPCSALRLNLDAIFFGHSVLSSEAEPRRHLF